MGKRIRFKFLKTGELRYLSHLDIISIITRALRRAKLRVKYSKGFNPKPKITFGPPIPLGIDSLAEYSDVYLADDIDAGDFPARLNSQLQGKLTISGAAPLPEGAKNLMSQVDIARYSIGIGGSSTGPDLERYARQAVKSSGLEGSIFGLETSVQRNKDNSNLILEVYGYTRTSKDRNDRVFKPRDFLESLKDVISTHKMSVKSVVKNELYILNGNKKITPFEVLQSFV